MIDFFKKAKRKRRAKDAKESSIRHATAILSALYKDYALNRNESGVLLQRRGQQIIVSLTTYSRRIDDVFLTIESIFQQSLKADRVILWLAKDDFSSADIPAILQLQQRRGLEIEFCDRDLGPYKKFFYTLRKYPDALILTVDDDVLYPIDMIDKLYRAYTKTPKVIHCYRAHEIRLDSAGNVLPYMDWELNTENTEISKLIFPTGVGGVLYFPGCFDEEILNQEAFMALAPKADDIWLKAMSLRKGVGCQLVSSSQEWASRFLFIEGSQKYALKHENMRGDAGNDLKFKAVFDAYSLWPLLRVD